MKATMIKEFDKLLMFVVLTVFTALLFLDPHETHAETWKLLATGAFSSLVTLLTKRPPSAATTTTTTAADTEVTTETRPQP